MSVDTMARLFELKNIVGVKDATGNLDRVERTYDGNELINYKNNFIIHILL